MIKYVITGTITAALIVVGGLAYQAVSQVAVSAGPSRTVTPAAPVLEVEPHVDPYYEHMAHVPGAAGWSNDWLDQFAENVCHALDTWSGENPAVILIFALHDQWGWEVDHAGVAVNAAVMANCSEHGPIPATKITRENAR